MSRARLVITAVVLEGRSQAEVARAYGLSRSWVSRLVARYQVEGEAAFAARSRRPLRSPGATDPSIVALIVQLRGKLVADGLDAGAHTIAWHLATHHDTRLAPATIWRHLKAAGLIDSTPSKRPRTSYVRFEADLPNQLWQTDFTHVRLADGQDVEVLTFIDDHSRLVTACTAHHRVRGGDVVTTFRAAISTYGVPAAVLSDNGMVFTTRLAGGRGGRNAFRSSWPASASSSATPDRTTPPPAARSNASSRPSNTGSPPAPDPTTSPPCRPCSTPGASTTTPHARTAHYTGAPPQPPTPPAPKPPPPPAPTPTPASGTTASTSKASSPSATAGDCTTSASDEPTPEPP
jgi:transposase InsO family protein